MDVDFNCFSFVPGDGSCGGFGSLLVVLAIVVEARCAGLMVCGVEKVMVDSYSYVDNNLGMNHAPGI